MSCTASYGGSTKAAGLLELRGHLTTFFHGKAPVAAVSLTRPVKVADENPNETILVDQAQEGEHNVPSRHCSHCTWPSLPTSPPNS